MKKELVTAFYDKMANIGKENKNILIHNDKGFVRYEFELDEIIMKQCDPYEEKIYRFIFREAYRSKDQCLMWTGNFEEISEGTNISIEKIRKTAIPNLVKKKLLYREKLHHRSPYTYVILVPEGYSGTVDHPKPANQGTTDHPKLI